MLNQHSATPPTGGKMTVMGRPGTDPDPAWVSEPDAADAYPPGDYKDPEVVNRWLDWESD